MGRVHGRGVTCSRDLEANEAGAELYREMVRRVVEDPETADGLSPRDLPIGCKRPILHTDYYETFNHDHVTLVDLRRGAIEEITPTGIRTAQGEFELDMIVYATGFDAMTGALDRIDIRGRDGLRLRDAWAHGARTLLGSRPSGSRTLFTVTGPGSPSVLANMVVCAEQHVEWIGECLLYLREHGYTDGRADGREAQDAWVEKVNRLPSARCTRRPRATRGTWATTSPGSRGCSCRTSAGSRMYIEHCDAVVAAGYEGFEFS